MHSSSSFCLFSLYANFATIHSLFEKYFVVNNLNWIPHNILYMYLPAFYNFSLSYHDAAVVKGQSEHYCIYKSYTNAYFHHLRQQKRYLLFCLLSLRNILVLVVECTYQTNCFACCCEKQSGLHKLCKCL